MEIEKNNLKYQNVSQLPLFLTSPQVAEILQIGRSTAYNLMKSKGFPSIKIGRSVRVYRDAFIRWMQENSRENGEL